MCLKFLSQILNFQESKIKPRFPKQNGQPRPAEDRTKECFKWAYYGACKLDQHFQTSKDNPTFDSWVDSFIMFDFMQKTCLKTCGWAERGRAFHDDLNKYNGRVPTIEV